MPVNQKADILILHSYDIQDIKDTKMKGTQQVSTEDGARENTENISRKTIWDKS